MLGIRKLRSSGQSSGPGCSGVSSFAVPPGPGTPEQVLLGGAAGAAGTTRPSKPCARHFRQRAGAIECLLPAAGGAEAERGAGPAQPWTGSWGEWRLPAQRGAVRGGGERCERGAAGGWLQEGRGLGRTTSRCGTPGGRAGGRAAGGSEARSPRRCPERPRPLAAG